MSLEIVPIEGIGAVAPGDDLLSILGEALGDLRPRTGDVLVVTHKIVSKAEGRVVHIDGDP
ncbi:MAG: coenzyme F420-0:L-glutamate ligase, partial [Acidimicrobiia bacterium]|nr:coenzyme F420-0:L-glutamate ligase [Acidimicrobiia bacterium]